MNDMIDDLINGPWCTYEGLCLFMEKQINTESRLFNELFPEQIVDKLFVKYPMVGMIKPKNIYSLNPPKYDGIQVYTKDGWVDIVNDEA